MAHTVLYSKGRGKRMGPRDVVDVFWAIGKFFYIILFYYYSTNCYL
jgi:hypothetical protein